VTVPGKVFPPAYKRNLGPLNSLLRTEALVGVFGLSIVPPSSILPPADENTGGIADTPA